MVRAQRPGSKTRPAKKSSTLKSNRTRIAARGQNADDESWQATANSFPVVGIGASAGGLEAFTRLLKHLPVDTGMAFVLVQHLDPVHESALTKLLSKTTSMPVREVTNNTRVQPDQVNIIPPNTSLTIDEGVLKLQPRKKTDGLHRPIDHFFHSLAEDQHERAISVILSGTASDGTLGCEVIKAEGGITFAQDDSAKYDSMPRSAIAAGCIDFVLSPEGIAKELARIASHPYVLRNLNEAINSDDLEEGLPDSPEAHKTKPGATDNPTNKILALLRNSTGVDFSLYKPNTINRRITRRMVLGKAKTLEAYLRQLKGDATELDALYQDLLIGVTGFFRNPEAFEVLKQKVFPRLLKNRSSNDTTRVWVLGCSTGQEAYSIAMAYLEFAGKANSNLPLQIFATDLNDSLLEKARGGLYAKNLVQDLSTERLRRFFVQEDGGYRISKSIREMCVFARQNLITDPPFSRLDLISCRNLMIYLEPALQKKIIPTFHYALKPNGFLLLGASETIGANVDVFAAVDKKHKIYSKKPFAGRQFSVPLPARHAARDRRAPAIQPLASREGLEINAQKAADRITLSQYAPAGVLINADFEVLQFRGMTSPYLSPAPGRASFNLLKMAREGLMLPLRTALNKAKAENQRVRKENVPIDQNGRAKRVTLEVIPLKNTKDRNFLILFEPEGTAGSARVSEDGASTRKKQSAKTRRETMSEIDHAFAENAELRRELAETREYLQTIQEEHEAATDEVQASSEEVQSANEELQSINEELETSKEELESTNEELITVNEEMQTRNQELNRLNSDLINLQTSTRLAILLLDRDLTIRRFSAQAERQFNLLSTDVGRPIASMRHNLDLPDLEEFIGDVIRNVEECEREVRDRDGRWYSLRVRPYIGIDNKVDGAVVILVDISALKRTESEISGARDYAEAIIETIREPLIVLDEDQRVQTANRAFYEEFLVSPDETQSRLLYELGNHQWDIPKLRTLLREILPNNNQFHDFEVEHEFENIGHRTMLLNARRLEKHGKQAPLILLAIEDITDRKQAEEALRESEAQLALELTGAQRLQETSTLLIQGGDINALYRQILDTAIVLMHSDMGSLQMFYPDRGELRLLAWKGFDPESAAFWEWVRPAAGSTCAVALSTGQRVIAPDVETCDFMAGTKDLDAYRISSIRSVQSTPLVSRAGKIVGMISTHWRNSYQPEGRELRFLDVLARQAADLIERTQTEQMRATLASIVQFSDDAIISKDLNGVITSWNKGAERLFGYTPQEAIGQPVTLLIPPERFDEEPGILKRVRRGESVEHYETVRHHKDGTRLDISLTVSPIRNEQGRIVGASKIARDITERKQTEKELKNLMANEKAARAEAEAANRVKDEFLAIVSHELRTPLNAIVGWTHLLMHEKLDPRQSEHAVQTIDRNATAQTAIISELLDVSRIISGKLKLDMKPVDLADVINYAVDVVRPAADAKQIAVVTSLDRNAGLVAGEFVRLQQVIWNLLTNAIKFTPNEGRVEVHTKSDGTNVAIVISDTGVGIPADFLPHIFERFQQADASEKRTHGGLGLGLSIVRNLVEMHGGSVIAESEGEGLGARFTVTFPTLAASGVMPSLLAPQDRNPEFSASRQKRYREDQEEPHPDLEPDILKGARVLAVDDQADTRDLIILALTRYGAEVRACTNAIDALRMIEEWKPKVIVSDIGMPGEDGYELMRKIRALTPECGGTIPAVALTGYAGPVDESKAYAAGYQVHMTKPVALRELATIVAQLAADQETTHILPHLNATPSLL